YWECEELLANTTLLQQINARFPLTLFTGRNPNEAELALIRTQLVVPPPLRWVADGRPRKPEPDGLIELTRELLAGVRAADEHGRGPGHRLALFVGDTADDQRAAEAARARGAPLLYAHVSQPGDTARVLTALLDEAK